MKFDGKLLSNQILVGLRVEIYNSGVRPRIGTILVGDDKASKIYTNLKSEAAKSIGAEMQVFEFPETTLISPLIRQIARLNEDQSVHGIMIQLPLPEKLSKYKDELISLIDSEKDVDGLKKDSPFTPATVKAIQSVLEITKTGNHSDDKLIVAVVGAKGEIGKRLVGKLNLEANACFDIGDDLTHLKGSNVVISVTGQSRLIKPGHIKKGVAIIDVGSPKPEFDEKCYEKASFYTPVPGGVGPMTIASLMQNLVDAAIKIVS